MAKKWNSHEGDKEKYAAYLCSREWNVLKEKVKKRCNETCERCGVFRMTAVHHLTYARKYHEDLDDLQAICQDCHDFTHGKSDYDPSEIPKSLHRYVSVCLEKSLVPYPFELFSGMFPPQKYHAVIFHAIDMLYSLIDLAGYPCDLDEAALLLNSKLPFDYHFASIYGITKLEIDVQFYDWFICRVKLPKLPRVDVCDPSEVGDF